MHSVHNVVVSAARRYYATTQYVPPASMAHIMHKRPPLLTPPESPNFYTGRASYFDHVAGLESAVQGTRTVLQTLQLMPLPDFARQSIPPPQHVWLSKIPLSATLNTPLTMSRYRRLLGLLNQLDLYKRIADVAGVEALGARIADVLAVFEKGNKEAVLASKKRKPVQFDEYGRSYTLGRRKTSTARVWAIAVQRPEEPVQEVRTEEPLPQFTSTVQSALDDSHLAPVKVTSTNIIINNTPLAQYFPNIIDRERVIQPFKVTGLVGAYNIFAIVRGGGLTGQSGALSLGIAKALAAHAPDVESLLRKAKLMRRDPRMVERKKPGRAKARKAYSWVKR